VPGEIDHLVHGALESGSTQVRVVSGAAAELLEPHGGIAALLRW
jgi:hypothetical protein